MNSGREREPRPERWKLPWTLIYWIAMFALAAWSWRVFQRRDRDWQRLLAENMPFIILLIFAVVFLIMMLRKRRKIQ